ncbi:MAG: hypothetical protein IMY74_03890 [Bacteroidetes bacterium]|nr:hypothetical protein [Bacteroidota bacterium]MCK5766590.1 hypothetical protein [Bacteroidales bacterium]
MKKLIPVLITGLTMIFSGAQAQNFVDFGQVSGSFQFDGQYYMEDDKLGITDSTLDGKLFRMNGFGNIIYTNGNFRAGFRYEAYLPPIAGYNQKYEGHGIPYYFAEYQFKNIQITVGNFYEQFGNGLVLRSYEEWTLGYDNSIRGARVKIQPYKGIALKGLIGTQRYYWEPYANGNRGIVKGIDAEFYLNDMFNGMADAKTKIILGGSFVSNYEKVADKTLVRDTTIYKYNLPSNVAAYAGRLQLIYGGFQFNGEYAYKINNPSAMNNYIYKNGESMLATFSYSRKGLGVSLSGKRIDNMSYKSRSSELGEALDINYLPPLTNPQAYSLATIYPYATQPNGEIGIQAKVNYMIPKRSKLGGKYGTRIELNYSNIFNIDKQPVAAGIPVDSTGTLGYKSDFFAIGQPKYFESFDVLLNKKFNSKFKMILSYVYQAYNIDVIEGHTGEPIVYTNIAIADLTYRFTPTKSLRFEYQQLFTRQDRGDWVMALLEFNIAPKWFFTVFDEYNYGNPDKDMQLHYYSAAMAFVQGTSRIALSYGRQREGLLCVGGVCRAVPAANGVTLTISSSF